MAKNTNKYIGFAVVIILVICVVVGIVMSLKSKPHEDEITNRIRDAMKIRGITVSKKNDAKAREHANNPVGLLNTSFPKWNRDSEVLGDLCLYAINLMEYIAVNGDDEVPYYSKIVRAIIVSIKNELAARSFRTMVPWGNNWFSFSVHVTRLFTLFQYFGKDSSLGHECHKEIMKIVSSIGVSLRTPNRPHKQLNLFYMVVPRLCSNYMYDQVAYNKDINTKEFKDLQKYLQFLPMDTEDIREGLYKDHSCIYSNNVASYEPLRLYNNFHVRVYQALGFETGFKKAAIEILPKILHPTIPLVPLGVFGRTGNLVNTRDYSIEFLEKGIFIAPFIGFGVFKTTEILFYVRVQRPHIAAYQVKKGEGSSDLALGWVQMRKIYHKRDANLSMYKEEMTWNTLKIQPGLLTFDDGTNQDSEVFVTDEGEDVTSFMSDKIDSFIGQINKKETNVEKKLLFWKNSYKFPQAYNGKNVEITEVAVVTAKGLQAHYTINNVTDKQLRFHYKDPKTKWSVMTVDGDDKKEFHLVPTGKSNFKWKMLSDDVDYNVEFKNGGMTFKFLNKDYEVTVKEQNESFNVTCDGGEPEVFYMRKH